MDTPAIKEEIKRMDPNIQEHSHDFRAAVILLAMLEVGTDARALFHWTGYGIGNIRNYLNRWEKNGVIKEGIIYHGGWDDEDPQTGAIAFWLDVSVGTGMVERVDDEMA